jgi:hypothetical protein
MPDQEPIPQFAKRIKQKYPQYKDVDDTLLVQKITEKYPEYRDMVDMSGVSEPEKKKEPSKQPLEIGGLGGGVDMGFRSRSLETLTGAEKIAVENEYVSNLENEIKNTLGSYKAVSVKRDAAGARSGGDTYTRNPLNIIDTNDPAQYGQVIDLLKRSNYLEGADGKADYKRKEQLIQQLDQRAKIITSKKGITPSIRGLEKEIEGAVLSNVMGQDRGEKVKTDVKDDQQKVNHFKLGLSHIEKTNPVQFQNVLRTISRLGKVTESDFSSLSHIGQEIENIGKFRAGAYNPEWIGSETNFDYTTYGQKKASVAGAIGEKLKEKGYKNQNRFTGKQIREAAKELGVENKQIVEDLVREEKILFYDAIPKSGWMDDVASGIMQPIAGIKKSIQSVNESPAETYMRSQQLDEGIGGQKVPDKKGQYSDILPSERGDWKTHAFRGLGQFLPQIVLARGLGSLGSGAVGTTGATLNAAQRASMTNYFGTAASTAIQTYGQEYEDALARTGDSKKAALLATIDSGFTAAWEMMLPDVKIAQRSFDGIKKALSGELSDLVRLGGNPAELAQKARPYIQKAVGEIGTIWGKEIGEELGTNFTDYMTELIFSPASAKERDFGREMEDTFKTAAAASLIPALAGGGMGALQKEVTVNTLHSGAYNLDEYRSSLEKSLANEDISQKEFDDTVKLLETHRSSLDNAPKKTTEGETLSEKKRQEYAYQNTLEEFYSDQIDQQKQVNSDKIQLEPLEAKRDAAQAAKREIYTEPKVELTEDEAFVKEALDEGLIPEADGMMLKDEKGRFKKGNVNEYLKFVAEQARGGREEDMVVRGNYSPDIIKLEKETHPSPDNVSQPIELDPSLPEGYQLPEQQTQEPEVHIPQLPTNETIPQGQQATTEVNEQAETSSVRPRIKSEIDLLPEKDRDAAIDDLIYGYNEVSKDIFDRKTGKPVPVGRYILSDFLKKNQISGNETAQNLLKEISGHPYFDGVKLYVTDKMTVGEKGEAIVTAGLMKVGPNADAETISHEMMHFLTARIFSKKFDDLLPSEKKFRNEVIGVIKEFDQNFYYLDKTLGKLGYSRSEYAKEVIAEAFTGSWFAKELDSKQVKVLKTVRVDKNLIQRIIDKIIEFFGGKISEKSKTVESRISVVEALKNAFVKHGNISAERLKQINVPDSSGRYESLKSREVDVQSAINRMLEAGYTKEDILKEFSKRGIPYPEVGPPSETIQAAATEAEQADNLRLAHADTEQLYKELGLPLRMETPNKKRETLIKEAQDKIEKGYNFDKVAQETMTGDYRFDDVDQMAFTIKVADLKAKQKGLSINDPQFEELQNQVEKYARAADVAGTIMGRALEARKSMRPVEETLSDYVMVEKEIAGVDALTDQQKQQVEKEYKDISETEATLNQRIAALEAANTKLKADQEVKKEAKKTKKTDKKDFKKERQDIIAHMREKLKDARKDTQATILPYAKELIAIAPDVAKLMKSYVAQGITELSDVVKKIHEDLKPIIPDIKEKDVLDIIAGEYSEKRTKNELQAQLRDLRDEAKLVNELAALLKGEEPKSENKKVERNQRIKDLREKIKKLKNGETEATTPEERYKKKLEKQIAEIEEELKTGNFSESTKNEPIKLDKETQALKDKLIKLKNERQLRLLKLQYERSSKWEKFKKGAANVLNVPRTLMATLDYSAPLRQALVATISHPKLASQAFLKMFAASFSQKNYDRWFYDLQNSDRHQLMKDSKLAITDTKDPKLIAREEEYMSNLAQKIPIIGRLVKGSERAYSMYLNKMRVDVFNRFVDQMQKNGKTFENSPDAYKQMAAFVNNITGRGDLGETMNKAAPILNALFFSPRLIASRLNTLTYLAQRRFYTTVPKEVRIAYFKDVATTAALGLLVLTLANAAGADTDDDPASPDFGKIKSGNTRWDIWGGHQQYIRAVWNLWPSKGKSVITAGRSKLSPIAGLVADIIVRENVIGEKLTTDWESKKGTVGIGENLAKHLLPLMATGMNEAIQDQGIKALFTVGVPSIFGVGTQTYQEKKKK